MQHFRYINTIRRPDGSLRPWEEHDILSKYEVDTQKLYPHEKPRYEQKALELKSENYQTIYDTKFHNVVYRTSVITRKV